MCFLDLKEPVISTLNPLNTLNKFTDKDREEKRENRKEKARERKYTIINTNTYKLSISNLVFWWLFVCFIFEKNIC